MRRILVLGGYGFFGGAVAELLRADGAKPQLASRREGAEVVVDVEDPASLRRALRPGDVLVDTVGPFQARTPALVDAAIEVGCDLIDLSDSVRYTRAVLARDPRGSRILTACSTLSTISAAAIRRSGLAEPRRLTVALAPASRRVARAGTGGSLLAQVGAPVDVLREGRWAQPRGFGETRGFRMPPPFGRIRGGLLESVDAVTLPRVWPSLETVEFFLDPRAPGLRTAFSFAARSKAAKRIMLRLCGLGMAYTRAVGATNGCVVMETEGAGGDRRAIALVAREHGYFTPAVPAALAALAIARGSFPHAGHVPPDRHVEPDLLWKRLEALDIRVVDTPAGRDN
ncbi:MAG TPA: saccharopine dehydrogenase NADP-binding domain-containing protein [Planctomycetota bacterium]|nr:saccharopine dehydrogenase NADP-binding domain-containing protein [Planctomycetota bacterium]